MRRRKMPQDNYILAYYQGIKDGSICVGKWIELVYEMIVQGIENKTYVYDQKKANAAVDWIEHHCFHSEGIKAPNRLELELWQKAFVSCLFGLLDPKTGYRQFREVVLIVARKNGKSLLAAAIAKYEWLIDGGYGSRVYCLAPKLEQSEILYNDIWQMVLLDPEYQDKKREAEDQGKSGRDDPTLERHRMTDLYLPATNSTVKKIAFSSKKSDGFNPSLCICDEVASWQGDAGLKQYEVMKSGMGARPEGFMLSCSTAGYVNDSIYDELIKRCTAVLTGSSKESRLLPMLYIIDDIEKWNDLNELRKSNPNLGISVTSDYLIEEIAVAEGSLSKRAEFICKYCNLKQNSSTAWLEYKVVDSACGDELKLEDFRGSYCVGGIDLSKAIDLTSCCVVIHKGGKDYVFSKFFMPRSRVETAIAEDGVPYNIFIEQGLLTLSGENHVDYHDVTNWYMSLVKDYEIFPLKIGFDRYSSTYLVDELRSLGFHLDDVYQGTNLSPIIVTFEGLLKDGDIKIGNNNLLKSHFLNSALKIDAETQRSRLVKLGKYTRIDGMAALLDAYCMISKYNEEIGQQLKNEEW